MCLSVLSLMSVLVSSWSSQGSSSVGVKKQKVESWERSVGGLGGKGALGSLVVRKKPADSACKPAAAAPRQAADTQTGSWWSWFAAHETLLIYWQCWKHLCCFVLLWKLFLFKILWIVSSKEQWIWNRFLNVIHVHKSINLYRIYIRFNKKIYVCI